MENSSVPVDVLPGTPEQSQQVMQAFAPSLFQAPAQSEKFRNFSGECSRSKASLSPVWRRFSSGRMLRSAIVRRNRGN